MWAAEADIDEEVDSILAIGSYGQGHFEDGMLSQALTPFVTADQPFQPPSNILSSMKPH